MVLGDVVVVMVVVMVMVAIADVVAITVAVADVDAVTITQTIITQTKQLLMPLDSILWWNGINFLLKSRTRYKIWKEHDKKGEPGRTKCIIGDISIEHVTAIISAMQQVQLASPTEETELTSNTTQVGNSFGSKANVKKSRNIE